MIFGKIDITPKAVETHRDSYKIDQLSVVGVRRAFLPFGAMMAVGGSAFGWQFFDLLYPNERIGLAIFVSVAALVGFCLGHLQLLSRDLRGSELRGAVWGTYGHLNRIRRQIMNAMRDVAHKDR
ncbi:hypothetical protein [uncultured Roseobacter sp.]|uniref:hypothetical protein n=1 Tax=uncultured Roseobacter sp. TaxID=114847 RepID=UPI002623D39A|nr:hypothetical protein [uncultured Roseobacter sp.]